MFILLADVAGSRNDRTGAQSADRCGQCHRLSICLRQQLLFEELENRIRNKNCDDETSSQLTDASFCPHPASPPSPRSPQHFLALLRPSP